ncbi:MAG: hypothetical protein GYA52_03060 [Chloroflexi bacterium]|nr:hypothetical protein [Chloroflexota bacterium]
MKTIFDFRKLLLPVLALTLLIFSACTDTSNQQHTALQTAQVTLFAPTAQPAVVELRSATAGTDQLTFTIAISGLELVSDLTDFDNIICEPYLRTDEHVQFTSYYRESDIPTELGDPILITYAYGGMQAADLQQLHVHVDVTLGPCGPDFHEMSVTPAPRIDPIANYSLSFTVPIED